MSTAMNGSRRVRQTYATERLAALSDGIFSVGLTLLVLDLKIPELPAQYAEQVLIADLRAQVPNFLAWLVSFVLLARLWIVHHAVVASLARCHVGTMIWNFVVLALVSLVPFAASLIGSYEFDPIAIAVFAVTLGLTGLSVGLFARHAARETHLHREEQVTDLQWHWRYHARVLPGVAAGSILLLGVDTVAALAVWLVEPIAALVTALRRAPKDR